MNNVIKLKTPLTGPIPPRFNSAYDERFKIPKLFEYKIKYDRVSFYWHIWGRRVIDGQIVEYHDFRRSRIEAIAFYKMVIPDFRIVH